MRETTTRLALLATIVVVLCSSAMAGTAPDTPFQPEAVQQLTLLVLRPDQLARVDEAISVIEKLGGRVELVADPGVLLAQVSIDVIRELKRKPEFSLATQAALSAVALQSLPSDVRRTAKYFNAVLSGERQRETLEAASIPFPWGVPHVGPAPAPKGSVPNMTADSSSPFAIQSHSPFNHMLGRTGVDLFLVESNGAIDQNEFYVEFDGYPEHIQPDP